MTENDQRLTKNLTEGALPPGHSEGTFACPGYHANYKAGREYPAGHIACPWRIRGKHYCHLDENRRRLASKLRYATQLQREWDIGNRFEGHMDQLMEVVDDIGHLRGIIAADVAEHVAIEQKCARLELHATNSANAESKRGPWELTLTYSPKEHGWTSDEAKEHMRIAIERLTRYYREEIEEFHAVGELTQSGQPHVHAWYKLEGGRRVTTKSFQRAYPIWNEKRKLGRGHEGGHHEPVKRTSDFDGYIEKHLDTAWLNIHITNEPRVPQEAAVPEASDDEAPLPSEAQGTDAAERA